MSDNKFYDQGWNAFIDGELFDPKANYDWRDGYTDCAEAKPEQRQRME